jgi:CRISPR-associated endonuclease/helicase Cas3
MFLSIIDQNASVIARALGLKDNSQSPVMVTHHHLAKLLYEDEDVENESYSTAVSQLLIEGWNAEVIVTTFVQFLETIIGARASSLRKLHNIAGAIIILDEVQSIDYKHWLLVHDCLEFLAKEFSATIILMTATQPLIFKKDEVNELFDARPQFSERVELKVDLNGISLKDFLHKLNKIVDDNPRKSVLVIMNTIASSVSVFHGLIASKHKKFYLSSEITPFERKQRIKDISKRLKAGKRTILVSTQVVEAGVDFDFHMVIRDLAPIDSLIQAAGRCNRNGKKPTSESHILYLLSTMMMIIEIILPIKSMAIC